LVFIIVVAVDVLTLVIDAACALLGEGTITAYVIANPIWGIPLLFWQLIGAAGLAIHLYDPNRTLPF
jgi:hypothetical protein